MGKTSGLVVFVVAGLAFGCSAGTSTSGEGDAVVNASAEPETALAPKVLETLADFKVQGIRYTFVNVDGDVGLNVEAPIGAPLPTLKAANGSNTFTMLEIYQALQPNEVPNEQLVSSHVRETTALGRLDASVVKPEVITTQEKAEGSGLIGAWATCADTFLAANGFFGTYGVDFDYSTLVANSGSNWTFVGGRTSKFPKAAGVCNGFESPALAGWQFAVDRKTTTGFWQTMLGPKSIAVGSYDFWAMAASTVAFTPRVRTTAHPASLAYLDLTVVNKLHN
jgi:hypothetical protein